MRARELRADAWTLEEIAVERLPVTVVCSRLGWIRVMRGHVENTAEIKYKEGDRGRFLLHAQTTDKLIVFGTDGRFYTLPVDKLPRGRKIPMDEINPPKPKKKLRERLPI